MYRINKIYTTQGRLISHTTPDKLTLHEARALLGDVQTRIYFSVKEESVVWLAPYIGLPLNVLLLETAIVSCETWSDIENTLTDTLVTSYATEIPGYVNGTSTYHRTAELHWCFNEFITDPDNPLGDTKIPAWGISYFDCREWSKRNVQYMCRAMPDLLLSCPATVNPDNCIVSVDGLILKSISVEPDSLDTHQQLLVKEGATYLRQCRPDYQPDLLVIDFTALGGVTKLNLSECLMRSLFRQDLLFKVPDTIDLSKCTPLLVLAGSLYFPHELRTEGQYISFPVAQCDLTAPLLRKLMCTEEYTNGTVVYTEDSVSSKEYLHTAILDKDIPDAFLILIHQPQVFVETHSRHMFGTPRWFTDTTEKMGIVRSRRGRHIVGYVDSTYHSEHVLYTSNTKKCFQLTELDTDLPVGTSEWNNRHTDYPTLNSFSSTDDDCVSTLHIGILDIFHLISKIV